MLSEPVPEEMAPFDFPPPQEPESDGYVDDWIDSDLYKYVKDLHFDKLVKKGLVDPEEQQRPSTANSQLGMNQSQKLEYNLNPEQKNILSYMEVDYGQSVMRHKSASALTPEMQQDLFDRSKTTIEVLTMNMVRPDICNHILFTYYQEVTKKNCIKLLLRCKRLYDARNDAIGILKMCSEVELVIKPKSAIWRILQDHASISLKKGHHAVVMRTLKVLSTAVTRIAIFDQENRLFNHAFKFNKMEYKTYLCNISAIIGGFLLNKRQVNPHIEENGQLVDKHDEHENQRVLYNDWVSNSIQEYGVLDLPSEKDLTAILPETEKKTTTRVDGALRKLKEDMIREEAITLAERRERASMKSQMKNKINLITSNNVTEQDEEDRSEVESEHQKQVISDQLIDRMKEREERKLRLQEMQLQAEAYPTEPDKPSKQYGLNLLKQQLKYDDDMEEQKTISSVACEKELNYKEPVKRPDSNAEQFRSHEEQKQIVNSSEY